MARKKTNEEFIKEVYEMVGEEYVFLEEYVNNRVKIECKHNVCNYIWKIRPSAFLSTKHRCPNCAGNAKKTNEEFVDEVQNLVGDEYIFLGEYTNTKTKIKCRHNIKDCNFEWDARPDHFLEGVRCPQCVGRVRKDNDYFIKEVYDLVGDEYVFLEKYNGNKTKIKCRHNIESCGYEWSLVPSSFINLGTRCPKCYHVRRTESVTKTNKDFTKEVYDLVGDEYLFLEGYINAKTIIKCKHNKCGHIWEIAPDNFLNSGQRCPRCNASKGENIIRLYLECRCIKYESGYTFEDCRNERPLPFDFYLPKYNLLIEYDGEQHYREVKFFGGKEGFEYRKHNDKIKNKYCQKNNINLLRIPYWDFDNIGAVLDDWFDDYNTKVVI